MSKVTVSKEVAAAITYLRTRPSYDTDDKLLLGHAGVFISASRWAGAEVCVLNDVPMDTFASAVLNGYEIEQTAEERVLAFFETYSDCDDYDSGVRFGALEILDIFGMKVKGVNV